MRNTTLLNALRRFLWVVIATTILTACSKQTSTIDNSSQSIEPQNNETPLQLTVYKSPSCGCCGEWVDHMEKAGFSTTVNNIDNLNPIKNSHGIAPAIQSCHTAVSENYVFEGHIPATVVKQFLTEKPSGARGLTVPGMPLGSPGMEMGDRRDAYDVLMIKDNGTTELYAHIDKAGNITPVK